MSNRDLRIVMPEERGVTMHDIPKELYNIIIRLLREEGLNKRRKKEDRKLIRVWYIHVMNAKLKS